MVVVHSMGEWIRDDKILSARELLDKYGLSAHILVHPDGRIERMREDHETAFHAKGFNKGSLGIEFLVPGIHTYETFLETIKTEYLTDQAYHSGLEVVREWYKTDQNVVRHSDIDPSRKKDPGDGFPWERFLGDLT